MAYTVRPLAPVMALPVDIRDDLQKRYRGTMNMYREAGFLEIEKHDAVSVMWLAFPA